MEERRRLRRRADSATVAGDQLLLYRPEGEIARVAIVVDQLDDHGHRLPLVADVLSAFPHGELHVVEDHRRERAPIVGRTPVVWAPRSGRGFWRRRGRAEPPTPELDDYDLVLRLGDLRARVFIARADALDLSYVLAVEGDDADELGASLHDRQATQTADVVWCATRRLMATLRRRWHVDAQLLYPPAELGTAPPVAAARRLLIAAVDGSSAFWDARIATLARCRPDLQVVRQGAPARCKERFRPDVAAATSQSFRALLPQALAVVMPPGDAFDPRAIWAAESGVPVVAAAASASAEMVEGLDRREPTGVVMEEPSDTALLDAVSFIARRPELFSADRLRRHAARWSHARFRRTLKSLVFDAWCGHLATRGRHDPEAGTPAAPREATGVAAL